MINLTINPKKKEVELRVHDADQSHVGRGIITLDRQSKEYLGVTSGDIVELEANKKTAAIIWPAKSSDEGKSTIRMDSLIRHSCGASLGEKVKVSKAVYSEAKKVVLAPTQEVRIIASGYDRILRKSFIGRPLSKGDNVWISVFGSGFIYTVVDTNPKGIVKVNDSTQFILKEEPAKEALEGVSRVAYEDIGGLEEQVRKVREMIELPIRHPELFTKLGISPPKGVLLHGPPGTGKTLLAKAVANETQAHFISVSAPQIMSKFVGEAEERIRQYFKEAEENAPSIIFIDELDAIAPKREEVIGEVERRVVAQLLSAMDGMEARGNVIVIAATNRVNSLDEALRRPGRFDREIEIGVPDKKGRKAIIQIHTRGMPLTPKEKPNAVDLDYFASITHGFVGADLEALAKESAMKALRRYLPEINPEEERINPELLAKMEVNKKDFLEALKEAQPSALREVLVEIPNVKWADIGSLNEVKEDLKQAVEWPLKNPEAFKKMGISPPRGVLLYGPPGTGKTLLAKAVANESEANFISIKGPELISKWVGESLPFDEELLVFDGKKIFREKIGKIVEEKKKLKVVTFDSDGKVLFSEIKDFIKHPLRGRMMQITTKTGRIIKVTDRHSIFTLKEGEIEEATPLELVEEKSVVAVPSRIPNLSLNLKEINLVELFKEDKGIMISGVTQILKKAIKKTSYSFVSKKFGVTIKYLYDIIYRKLPVQLNSFVKLTKHFNFKVDYKNTKVGVKGARSYIPTIFPFTEELFRLIGYWVAEGDYNSEIVRIHATNEEIKSDLAVITESLNLPCSLLETSLVINSIIFKKVLQKEFQLNSGAFNKRAPNILLSLNSSYTENFLKGYFSGDGCITKRERCFIIEATTVSKELANDLLYLLLKLGIVASCKEKKECNSSVSYRIQIQGAENFRKFLSVGFTDNKRNSRIEQNILERKWIRSNVIPADEKIKGILDKAFNGYPNVNFVGTKKLKEALIQIDLQKTKYKNFWKIVESDIYWDKVEKIEEIDYKGNVFDVSVEPCQNFLSGFGGIFAHNTERGIRKIFKKARQVSPVIVFFDEIDSLASLRGNTLDSGVGDKAVNQLLTELDGIEELKDMVFIAATNRPDLIDPGLLRPGRIDKMIMVPAPNEKARKEIFKIHLKNVPVEKEIDLEELVKKTTGFSGADIEGLVREASLISMKENKMEPKPIKLKHFSEALKKIRASISKETIEAYEEFSQHYSVFKPSYVE